jgi:uncharacterized repeat protein (TIGR01451 family)
VAGATFDPTTANNTATATTTLGGDLSVSITDSPDPVPLGGNVAYTIKVTNKSPLTATGVTLTNNLPVDVTLVSSDPLGLCSGTTTLTCNLGTLE